MDIQVIKEFTIHYSYQTVQQQKLLFTLLQSETEIVKIRKLNKLQTTVMAKIRQTVNGLDLDNFK